MEECPAVMGAPHSCSPIAPAILGRAVWSRWNSRVLELEKGSRPRVGISFKTDSNKVCH